MIEQQIIALSLAHQILSPYTAFVGVETMINRSDVTGPPIVRHIPIQISKDDEHLFFNHVQYDSISNQPYNTLLFARTAGLESSYINYDDLVYVLLLTRKTFLSVESLLSRVYVHYVVPNEL